MWKAGTGRTNVLPGPRACLLQQLRATTMALTAASSGSGSATALRGACLLCAYVCSSIMLLLLLLGPDHSTVHCAPLSCDTASSSSSNSACPLKVLPTVGLSEQLSERQHDSSAAQYAQTGGGTQHTSRQTARCMHACNCAVPTSHTTAAAA